MKKNMIFSLLIMIFIFLTGCSAEDDFISKAISDSQINGKTQSKDKPENTIVIGDESINDILEALSKTKLIDYIEVCEDDISVDGQLVLKDYIDTNELKSASMPWEDYLRLVRLENDKTWDNYRLVIDKEFVYIVNSDNLIMEEYCLILLSRIEGLKEAFESAGYENLYKIIESYDAQIISDIESGIQEIPRYSMDSACCGLSVSVVGISFWKYDAVIPKEALYLTKLYQNDEWVLQLGGTNSVCESLSFICELYELADEEEEWHYPSMRLDLFGSDEKLKEIKLTYENSINTIPLNNRHTITKCLKELGCTDDEISRFYEEFPQKSGNIGDLYFITDKINADNNVIKLYVK